MPTTHTDTNQATKPSGGDNSLDLPRRFTVVHRPTAYPHPINDIDSLLWLTPGMGPTATLLIYQLGQLDGHDTDIDTLAATLGVGPGTLFHTIGRLLRWRHLDLIGGHGDARLIVKTHLPALPERRRARQPMAWQQAYARWLGEPVT